MPRGQRRTPSRRENDDVAARRWYAGNAGTASGSTIRHTRAVRERGDLAVAVGLRMDSWRNNSAAEEIAGAISTEARGSGRGRIPRCKRADGSLRGRGDKPAVQEKVPPPAPAPDGGEAGTFYDKPARPRTVAVEEEDAAADATEVASWSRQGTWRDGVVQYEMTRTCVDAPAAQAGFGGDTGEAESPKKVERRETCRERTAFHETKAVRRESQHDEKRSTGDPKGGDGGDWRAEAGHSMARRGVPIMWLTRPPRPYRFASGFSPEQEAGLRRDRFYARALGARTPAHARSPAFLSEAGQTGWHKDWRPS
ncbi:hypothetical protein NFJ02_17g27200 [Pycnococcus provasolii]